MSCAQAQNLFKLPTNAFLEPLSDSQVWNVNLIQTVKSQEKGAARGTGITHANMLLSVSRVYGEPIDIRVYAYFTYICQFLDIRSSKVSLRGHIVVYKEYISYRHALEQVCSALR